jgi:hypothetical protein
VIWSLLQVFVDGMFILTLGALWIKLRRPPQDDPRLSRGLQLLQSKITILEDLSDRTDSQVKQLTQILDQKTRLIQDKILSAEQQIIKVDQSMQKSLEVAEIFQDKIPHEEVLERKRTIEYVKAARMANAGKSAAEISAVSDLPREQVELITKFNRDQLMFDVEALPAWAKNAGLETETPIEESYSSMGTSSLGTMDFLSALDAPSRDGASLEKVNQQFKASVRDFDARQAATASPAQYPPSNSMQIEEVSPATKALFGAANSITASLASTAANFLNIQETPAERAASEGPIVRKVQFPRIEMPPKY